MNVVNVAQKLSLVDKHWSPRIIAELNGQHVKVAKLRGEFDWHFHENEDELFWVVKGQLTIHLRGSNVQLGPGEIFVVPRGVEHKPEATEELKDSNQMANIRSWLGATWHSQLKTSAQNNCTQVCGSNDSQAAATCDHQPNRRRTLHLP